MRVLHILSKLNKGGAESRNIDMQKKMYEKGVYYDYLLMSDGPHFYTETAEKLGSRFYTIPHPSAKNLIQYIIKVSKIIKDNNYDVVHSHLSTFSAVTMIAAKLGGAKVRIAHSRSGPLESTVAKWPLHRRLALVVYRWLLAIFASVRISCSTDGAIYLFGKRAVEKGKIHYIHNAIEIEKYNQLPTDEVRKKYGVSPEQMVIIHVGNLLPVKNQSFLIDIYNEYVKLNPNSKLLIAGAGGEQDALQTKIDKFNLQDKAVLLGRCDNVPELLSIGSMFIMTSIQEGVPGAAMEAIAAGLPCFLSDSITKDIAFGDEFVRYFSIFDDPTNVAKFIYETQDSMSKDKSLYIKALKDNKYDVKDAVEDLYNIYIQ